MQPILMAVAVASMLSACAPAELRKDSGTSAEQHSEIAACELVARTRFPPGDPSMSNANSIEIEQSMRMHAYIRMCLQSNGWR